MKKVVKKIFSYIHRVFYCAVFKVLVRYFFEFSKKSLSPAVFSFRFTPQPNEGARHPIYEGKICYGEDLSNAENVNRLELKWLIKAYQNTSDKKSFFNNYFIKLAGTSVLQQQIEAGLSEAEIRKTWQSGLDAFKKVRVNYLIYSVVK